jgi:CDP-6-deoxy-D-xylo-4-hexulose-3-dehydrase
MQNEELYEELLKLAKGAVPKKKKFVPGETYIPVAWAIYDENEIVSLLQSVLDWRIVEGSITRDFEREFARWAGVRHASFCNSGSSANLLAFMALTSPKLKSRALQPGDEVITSAVGFPTTVAPILQAGCVPVFVDVTIGTYNPSSFIISNAITEKTKAIFLAHTLGNPFDVQKVKDICLENNLWLIEDCADALGSTFNGQKVGTFGNLATTSFYPAHMMTTGEGGMVFTDNAMLNMIIRSFRDWGRDCWCLPNCDNTCGKRFGQKNHGELPDGFDHKYTYSHVGFNLKSTDLQASIGLQQLKKLPEFVEKRKANWKKMLELFESSGVEGFLHLPAQYKKSDTCPFGFPLTVRSGAKFTRNQLTQYLESRKIGTRNIFGGNITKQPAFMGKGIIPETLHKADKVMNDSFWIGCHPGVTEEMVEYIVDTIKTFINEKEK